jgi:hypothetical protein
MDKLDAVLLYFAVGDICASRSYNTTCADLHVDAKRMARLLVLLKQISETSAELEALPEPELSEIVSSAIGVCGFVDPIEVRDVIAIVLDAIEMQDPFPERAASEGQGMGLSDT